MPYNVLTCAGWEQTGGLVASFPCMKARLGVVFLFFIIAIIRKWGGEEIGLEFSLLFALILGILPYFIIVTLFGSFIWAFIVGILGGIIGGYGAGVMFGGEGGGW